MIGGSILIAILSAIMVGVVGVAMFLRMIGGK